MVDLTKLNITVGEANLITELRETEEKLLSIIHKYEMQPKSINARWLSIGITDIQKGVNSIERAILRPTER